MLGKIHENIKSWYPETLLKRSLKPIFFTNISAKFCIISIFIKNIVGKTWNFHNCRNSQANHTLPGSGAVTSFSTLTFVPLSQGNMRSVSSSASFVSPLNSLYCNLDQYSTSQFWASLRENGHSVNIDLPNLLV